MRPLIQATLIHHELPSRAETRREIRRLIGQLNLRLMEVVEQPTLKDFRPSIMSKTWIISRFFLKSGVDALQQVLSGRKSLLRALWSFGSEAIRTIGRLGPASSEAWISAYRTCLIEKILVDKHLIAWETAVKNQASWLLVLEDDAQVLPNTLSRLRRLMDHDLVAFDKDTSVYCDLAGGFSPVVILPSSSAWDNELNRWSTPYVQTNTTCSYLASYSLIVKLINTVHRFPILRQLPADHLINAASLFTGSPRHSCLSLHWKHPFFLHGSFHSGLSSSISEIR